MNGDTTEILGDRRHFEQTCWDLVRRSNEVQALDKLACIYWKPLYFFVRERGYRNEDAKDIVQEFLKTLLERRTIAMADPSRGRFRTFLLTALTNFIRNWKKASRRQKRGDGRLLMPLDGIDAEMDYRRRAASGETVEDTLDRAWARNLWLQSLAELTGNPTHLEAFRMWLGGANYEAICARTQMDVAAAKTAVHRLRGRIREILVSYLRPTVSTEDEVAAELSRLEALLA